MSMGLKMEVEGDRRLKRKLESSSAALEDLRPPLRSTARKLRIRQREVFETAGRSQGTPWRPLSPATQHMRANALGYYRRGVGPGILRASGGLMRSYTDPSHPRHVEDIDRGGFEWGSTYNTAHLHASGVSSRAPAPPLPKRELLAFNDAAERRELFTEPIADHVFKGLSDKRGGGRA